MRAILPFHTTPVYARVSQVSQVLSGTRNYLIDIKCLTNRWPLLTCLKTWQSDHTCRNHLNFNELAAKKWKVERETQMGMRHCYTSTFVHLRRSKWLFCFGHVCRSQGTWPCRHLSGKNTIAVCVGLWKNWNVEELETLPAGTLPGSRRRRKHLICKSETERGPERSCKINTQGRMYLWWSLRTLYLHACQVRVTVGDSGLCCCTCVTYFELWLAPFCVALSIS